jgi:hypothetical protein
MISRQPIFTLTPYLLSGGAAHINCIVEQELPTIPEHLSLSLILSGVHVAQSLVVCVVFLVGYKLNNICVKNCSVFVANDELRMPNRQSEEFEDTKGVIRIRISKMNR